MKSCDKCERPGRYVIFAAKKGKGYPAIWKDVGTSAHIRCGYHNIQGGYAILLDELLNNTAEWIRQVGQKNWGGPAFKALYQKLPRPEFLSAEANWGWDRHREDRAS